MRKSNTFPHYLIDIMIFSKEEGAFSFKIIDVQLNIPLIAFFKELYPTYSNYLESLQSNGNLKEVTFDSLVKKFMRERKLLGRRQLLSLLKKLCVLHIERRIMIKILLEEEVVEEEEE